MRFVGGEGRWCSPLLLNSQRLVYSSDVFMPDTHPDKTWMVQLVLYVLLLLSRVLT